MNNQKFFEKTTKHLLGQGKKSKIGFSCKYRGRGDLKCAMGIHMSDDEYLEGMEGYGIGSLVKDFPELSISKWGVDMDLMVSLQNVHDVCDSHDWRKDLVKVAGVHELDTLFMLEL